MDITLYLLLALTNLLLIGLILYVRSPVSSEGWCAAFLFASALADMLELLARCIFWPEDLSRGPAGELELRIYPTEVHIIGMAAFLVGLLLTDARCRSLARPLTEGQRRYVCQIAFVVAIIGLALYGSGIFLVGLQDVTGLADSLVGYRAGGADSRFGGFWYMGMQVAVLGLTLRFVASRGRQRLLPGMTALLLVLFATANKGGLEKVLLFWGALTYAYQPKTFTRIIRRQSTWTVGLPIALLLVVIVIGTKNYVLGGQKAPSLSSTVPSGLGAIRARYSSEGLYHGYSLLVNNLHSGFGDTLHGRVLEYTLTGWVPRLLYPKKPVHPFWGLGLLIYEDRHVFEKEAPAPTLVGYAYTDGGLLAVVVYLGLGGMLLGLMRRKATEPHASIYWHLGYIFFFLFGGCSSESGFLGFGDTAAFAAAVMISAATLVFLMNLGKGRGIFRNRRALTDALSRQPIPALVAVAERRSRF